MKKTMLFALSMIVSVMLFAQSGKSKIEVLYFKANLACCKAKACNALEGDIQTIIQKNFQEKDVAFKQVKLSDEANKSLVEKYNAKSQTVIIVKATKKGEVSKDVSEIVQAYVKTQDKAALETELVAQVKEVKKSK